MPRNRTAWLVYEAGYKPGKRHVKVHSVRQAKAMLLRYGPGSEAEQVRLTELQRWRTASRKALAR